MGGGGVKPKWTDGSQKSTFFAPFPKGVVQTENKTFTIGW